MVLSLETTYLKLIDQLPDNYLACRDTQHRWDITADYHLVTTKTAGVLPRGGEDQYVERKLCCDRCKMLRSDAFKLGRRGGHMALERLSSTYRPPKGYAVKGTGRSPIGARDLVRGVRFERLLQAA